jgi:hypothetical protein
MRVPLRFGAGSTSLRGLRSRWGAREGIGASATSRRPPANCPSVCLLPSPPLPQGISAAPHPAAHGSSAALSKKDAALIDGSVRGTGVPSSLGTRVYRLFTLHLVCWVQLKRFEAVLAGQPAGKRDIDALVGLATHYSRKGDAGHAVDTLAEISAVTVRAARVWERESIA